MWKVREYEGPSREISAGVCPWSGGCCFREQSGFAEAVIWWFDSVLLLLLLFPPGEII